MRAIDPCEEYFEIEREAFAARVALLVGLILWVAVCTGRCGTW